MTHNREISRVADRVVELSSGRVASDGPPRGRTRRDQRPALVGGDDGPLLHAPLGGAGPAAPLGPGARRSRSSSRIGTGVYAGLGSTAEWRRQSNDASFALLHMYDLRVTAAEGVDAADRRDGRACWTTLPDPGIVATAEERLIADTQVDASTADESILVPGRLVGMDLTDGGPHVNGVYVAEGDGRAADRVATPAGPWCWSSGTSPTSTTSRPRRTLRVAGDQDGAQRRHRSRRPSTSS